MCCTFTSSTDDDVRDLARAIGKPRKLPAKRTIKREEQAIQKAVFQHLKTRARSGTFAFHPANGGQRSPIEAAIMQSMGIVAGVPDIIILHNGRFFAIELKAENGKPPTEAQMECVSRINACGGFATICRGLDSALRCLEVWGILRGKVA